MYQCECGWIKGLPYPEAYRTCNFCLSTATAITPEPKKEKPMNKSTYIHYKLVCGCTVKQRVDYRNSDIKRKQKTVLTRVYGKGSTQTANNQGAEYITIVANENCKEHWPTEKEDFVSEVFDVLAARELSPHSAKMIINFVKSRVRK